MEINSSMLINTSIIYRNSQKFFDKQLAPYDLNTSQLMFIILIYEHEGITMQALSQIGCYDKGTITKGIKKLEELDFIRIVTSENDKRARLLYTTDKVKKFIASFYLLRNQWWDTMINGMSLEEIEGYEKLQNKVAENSRVYTIDTFTGVKFFGLQKTTLLDYPGHLASTIFTGGCNFKCPFCQNSDLVFLSENSTQIDEDDILAHLNKRKNLLDGICVSGGEALLHDGLGDFLAKVKELGYSVKLDTNGSFPDRLMALVDEGLVDYVAMDVKNCKEKYSLTAGITTLDLQAIEQTIQYLLSGSVPYEFRTTVVKEFHTLDDLLALANWIKGAREYNLQAFVDSETVIQPGLHAYEEHELRDILKEVQKIIPNTNLRGL